MKKWFKGTLKAVTPMVEKAAGPAIKLGLDGLLSTIRHRKRLFDASHDPLNLEYHGGAIFALWHRDLMLPIWRCGRLNPVSIISQSKDGDLLADVA